MTFQKILRTCRQLIVVGLCVLCGCCAAWASDNAAPAPGEARSSGAVDLANIPIAAADENLETSRAITAILERSVAAYNSINEMHATISSVTAIKGRRRGKSETTNSVSQITVDYKRPSQLAIRVETAGARNTDFIANGKTVSQVIVDEKKYVQLPQPDSLAAFIDGFRAGELYTDWTESVKRIAVGQLLLSADPRSMYFDRIERYLYEGKDTASGRECYRIKFLQKNPEIVVIFWIDTETYLLNRVSQILSRDSAGNPVDSFEDGVRAQLVVIAFDSVTTGPGSVSDSAFQFEPPSDFKDLKKALSETDETDDEDEETSDSADDDGGYSLWSRLVSAAANSAGHPTTWTLEQQSGAVQLRVQKFAELSTAPVQLFTMRFPGATSETLVANVKNGLLQAFHADGSLDRQIHLADNSPLVGTMQTTTGVAMQFFGQSPDSSALWGWGLDGKRLWEYKLPFISIVDAAALPGEPAIILTLEQSGIRRVGPDGAVQFANRDVEAFTGCDAAPAGDNRLLANEGADIAVLDKDLHEIRKIPGDDAVWACQWLSGETDAPVVVLKITESDGLVAQRITLEGDVRWTQQVLTSTDGANNLFMEPARLISEGRAIPCVITATDSGALFIVSHNGEVLFRGALHADAATVERNSRRVIYNMAIGDLDGDGVDEAYVKLDKNILVLSSGSLR